MLATNVVTVYWDTIIISEQVLVPCGPRGAGAGWSLRSWCYVHSEVMEWDITVRHLWEVLAGNV